MMKHEMNADTLISEVLHIHTVRTLYQGARNWILRKKRVPHVRKRHLPVFDNRNDGIDECFSCAKSTREKVARRLLSQNTNGGKKVARQHSPSESSPDIRQEGAPYE